MDFNELLVQKGKTVETPKHEHVFRQGDANRSLHFVQSGMLKAYYTSSSGKESVKSFFVAEDIIGSLTAAYSKETSSYSLLCLEDTHLLEIPFALVYEYCQKHHKLATEMIDVLLRFSIKKEQREYELLCLTAEERYHLLIETSPKLLEKVTQNDIARYLGVTPVGLSRIKNRAVGRR